MNQSESIDELAGALAKAQGQFDSIKAAETATIKTTKGGEYSYTYATLGSTLQAIRKPLLDNGLAIAQFPETADRQLILTTRLLHSSGQWMESEMSAAVSDADIKSMGSVITYLRRYSLMSILALGTEDDDGSSAGKVQPTRRPASPKAEDPDRGQVEPMQWYDGKTRGIAAWLKEKHNISIDDLHTHGVHLKQFKTREEFIEWAGDAEAVAIAALVHADRAEAAQVTQGALADSVLDPEDPPESDPHGA